MSESKKPAGENKTQPAEQKKPTAAKQDRFSVGRVMANDSAENLNRKNK
ncbi:hypothetical protein [Trabulsiella odontotermitis]|nr:hypothetical protein [Trabulsiella odontotermitis]